jgi:hypothetical protein
VARPRDPRNLRIQLRVTSAELAQLQELATRYALPLPELLRLRTLSELPRTSLLDRDAQREIWRQVAGMARNINQLTKNAHSGQHIPSEELVRLSVSVDKLREAIMEICKPNERG